MVNLCVKSEQTNKGNKISQASKGGRERERKKRKKEKPSTWTEMTVPTVAGKREEEE